MTSANLSVSELSRRLRRSRAAVLKLARKGKIPRNQDGTFNEVTVRQAYARNVDPAWRTDLRPTAGGTASPKTAAHLPMAPDEAMKASASLIIRVLAQERRAVLGAPSADDIRAAEVILRCQKFALDLAATERELLPRDAVEQHVAGAYAGFRRQVEAIPERYSTQVAAAVGCDSATVNAALGRAIGEYLAGISTAVLRA